MRNAAVFCFALLAACQNEVGEAGRVGKTDTVVVRDTVYVDNALDWQEGFGLSHDPDKDSIWGRPVRFYISRPDCDPAAIDFYYGMLRPSDNHTTAHLLDLAVTDNDTLRPFYRWILSKTIRVQDGALAEFTGVPARRYAEKYPTAFFEYMGEDSSGQRYGDWTEAIGYSGFYELEDYKKSDQVRKNMISAMTRNCKACPDAVNQQIRKFAHDCFH